jgi:hypothetical protein
MRILILIIILCYYYLRNYLFEVLNSSSNIEEFSLVSKLQCHITFDCQDQFKMAEKQMTSLLRIKRNL